MPSVTTWTRIEPRSRTQDMAAALEARVQDPLWLLTRQWQTGEFRGEDAGSPIGARLRAESSRLTSYRAGPAGDPETYDPRRLPLETMVEREQRSTTTRPRLAAETGVHFVRVLKRFGVAQHAPAFAASYPLAPPTAEPDAASARYRTLMAHRVPDGVALRGALGSGALPVKPPIPASEQPKVIEAVKDFVRWYDARLGPPRDKKRDPWDPSRMEYSFAVSAKSDGKDVVLVAPEYPGGRLDWHDFRVEAAAQLTAAATSHKLVQTALPSPASYPGMPAPRLWEFEDANVHFGAVGAAPEDIARLLLIEFASVYGNDWFVIPVELEIGSICRVTSLVVTDTFGEQTLIRSSADADTARGVKDWSLFQLSRVPAGQTAATDRADLFFLPPALASSSLEGSPIEEVRLMRDEMANVAWAVERTVQSAAGLPVDRFEAYQAARQAADQAAPPPSGGGPELVYRLATEVPDYWVALIPEEDGAGGIRLRRGSPPGATGPGAPRGRLLVPDEELVVFEEEVPRAGARVTRSRQYTRWIGGSTHLWIGRRKRPGRGEGWSGLRFDDVQERAAGT